MSRVYCPRHPVNTAFYRILFHYFETFLLEYENRFERHFGHLRPSINTEKDITPGIIAVIQSFKRLSLDETQGQVLYQYGKHSAETESMDYPRFRRDKPLIKSGASLEFIARVTSHIPDKGQVMVRYYGLYANAHKSLPLRKQGKDEKKRC